MSKLQQAEVNISFWGHMSSQHISPFDESNYSFPFILSGRKWSPSDWNNVTSLWLHIINYCMGKYYTCSFEELLSTEQDSSSTLK